MSATPPKHDAWPAWSDVRFVFVRTAAKLRPCRGLILDWKRGRTHWEALVVYFDDAALKPVVKMDWLPVGALTPIRVDPNWTP